MSLPNLLGIMLMTKNLAKVRIIRFRRQGSDHLLREQIDALLRAKPELLLNGKLRNSQMYHNQLGLNEVVVVDIGFIIQSSQNRL